MMDSLTHTNPS